MNREQIERWTREAGCFDATPAFLESFAKAAYAAGAAAEREACAKVCDEQAESPALAPLEKYRASFIADAIRARRQP